MKLMRPSQNLLQESTEKDITWATAGSSTHKEERMAVLGSWPSFQEESIIENMQKSKINYLLTIPKSPKYPLCKTYLIFFSRHCGSSKIAVCFRTHR